MPPLKFFLATSLLLAALAAPARADEEEGCAACHSDEDMEAPVRAPALAWANDAHHAAGLSCTACHGGVDGTMDYTEAHDKGKGFRGKPKPEDVVGICAGCHDDPSKAGAAAAKPGTTPPGAAFRHGVHGQVEPAQGHELPTCISCHGAHGILPPTDERSSVYPTKVPETCNRCHGDLDYMRAFTSARVRVDQYIEYQTSVHGKRLAAGDTKVAVCSSCHGNHDIRKASDPSSSVYPANVAATCGSCHADPEHMKGYEIPVRGGGTGPIPTDQVARWSKSVHHEQLVEKGDLSAPTCNDCHGNHGATPPEVRAVANVCGQCHSRPAELFAGSGIEHALDEGGWPRCATCHGNHEITRPTDALLAKIAAGQATPGGWTAPAPWSQKASTLLDSIRRLADRIDHTKELVDRVANYGMDVTRPRLFLHQAEDQLVQARVNVHRFDPEVMKGILEGTEDETGALVLADRADATANDLLAERRFRRVGLAVALAFIALVVVALLLRIRRMERTPA